MTSTQYEAVALPPGPVDRVAVSTFTALHETNTRLVQENEYLRNAAIRWCEIAKAAERRATLLWRILVVISGSGLVLLTALAVLPGLLAWWLR